MTKATALAPPRRRRSGGEGTIYQLPDGRWRAEVNWLGPAGRAMRKTASAKTQREVKAKLAEIHRQRDLGMDVRAGAGTVGEFLEAWLDGLQRRVSPSTRAHHKANVAAAVRVIGRIPLAKLTPSDIERMCDTIIDGGRAPMTARHVRSTVRQALAIAIRDGRVMRNAARDSRPPRVEHKEMAALTVDETRRLLAACVDDEAVGDVVAVAVTTGLRQGELLALCWSDVDLVAATVKVRRGLALAPDGSYHLTDTKTPKSRRTVNLPTAAVAALSRRLDRKGNVRGIDGDGLVFTDELGRPVHRWNLTDDYQRLLARAGVRRIRFHDLRHTYATLALGADVPLQVVSRSLGHSTIAITANTYGHVVPDQMREAASALDRVLGAGVA